MSVRRRLWKLPENSLAVRRHYRGHENARRRRCAAGHRVFECVVLSAGWVRRNLPVDRSALALRNRHYGQRAVVTRVAPECGPGPGTRRGWSAARPARRAARDGAAGACGGTRAARRVGRRRRPGAHELVANLFVVRLQFSQLDRTSARPRPAVHRHGARSPATAMRAAPSSPSPAARLAPRLRRTQAGRCRVYNSTASANLASRDGWLASNWPPHRAAAGSRRRRSAARPPDRARRSIPRPRRTPGTAPGVAGSTWSAGRSSR